MPTCEMCGKETDLVQADIDGAELSVCQNCAKYGTIKRSSKPALNSHFKAKRERDKPEFKVVNNYSSLIKSARDSRDLSQEDFARLLNEKVSIVNKWEYGSLRPNLDTARKLERILKLKLVEKDTIDLLEEVIDKKSPKTDIFTLGDFIKVRKRK